MHSDDIPEEVYLMMAQDMLFRHRGDATDEVVRVLPSASAFTAGTSQKQSPGARPLTQRLAAAAQDLHAPSADFAVSLKTEEPPGLEDVDRVARRLKRLNWARNPWFIQDGDWSAMIDMGVTVTDITSMFSENDAHLWSKILIPLRSGQWLSRWYEAKSSQRSRRHASYC
jgi:hypothetical protein